MSASTSGTSKRKPPPGRKLGKETQDEWWQRTIKERTGIDVPPGDKARHDAGLLEGLDEQKRGYEEQVRKARKKKRK